MAHQEKSLFCVVCVGWGFFFFLRLKSYPLLQSMHGSPVINAGFISGIPSGKALHFHVLGINPPVKKLLQYSHLNLPIKLNTHNFLIICNSANDNLLLSVNIVFNPISQATKFHSDVKFPDLNHHRAKCTLLHSRCQTRIQKTITFAFLSLPLRSISLTV